MKLTAEQQRKAEENMGLVGKVIADKVHGTYFGSYTREDLFQIGCIGLCKAAATDKGGCRPSFKKRKEYLTWTGSKRTSASAALLQRPPYRAWPQSVRLPQMRQMRKGLSPAPAHPQAA